MSLFGFEIRRYLRGFLLLAIATAVFSLVNLALSAVPDTITIGGDLGELCGNATTAPTPTPTPAPTLNITNINFYDPFNTLDTVYWRNLTHPWIAVGGRVRTNVTDLSYNNAIYYAVDFIEPGHDTVVISTNVRTSDPFTGETRYYCAFLSTIDLNTRLLGCVEVFRGAHTISYARIRRLHFGSAELLANTTIENTAGIRDLVFTVVKLNETHVNVSVRATRIDGTSVSLSNVTVLLNWNDLGYFGFYMSRAEPGDGFDFVDVWITSVNATRTDFYNVNFPPPLPTTTITVTTTVTEILELGRDVLVIPVGSFIRVLSFMVYVVYIVRTVRHFVPEF